MPTARPGAQNDGGQRIKMLNLSAREKRSWMNRLTAAQESVETAEEARDRVIVEAYDSGISYNNIGAAMGLNGSSMGDRVAKIRERLGL